jgi:hypothetical protein
MMRPLVDVEKSDSQSALQNATRRAKADVGLIWFMSGMNSRPTARMNPRHKARMSFSASR